MEISVVITNFNYGYLLGRCLRSLLNQSLTQESFEIIVVDDASTDDSKEIYLAFADSIKLVQLSENKGLAYASNAGMKAATGRYVVRIDADDYVHADFLRTLLLGFEFFGKDYQAVSLDYLNVNQQGEYISYGDGAVDPIACAIAFKIDALEQIGFYNQHLRLNEEVDLRKRFIEKGFQIRSINLPLYRYVNHDASLSRKSII